MNSILLLFLVLTSQPSAAEQKQFESPDFAFETDGWTATVNGYGNFSILKEKIGEPTLAPIKVRVVISCSDPAQHLANPEREVLNLSDVCSMDSYEVKADALILHLQTLEVSGESLKCTKQTKKIAAKNICRFYRAPDSAPPAKKRKK